jgi:GTPase Era involved in 16S rRNA processing
LPVYIKEANVSVVLVVNKWDAVAKDTYTMNTFTEEIREKLDFLPHVPIIFTSALTGQRIHQLLETSVYVWEMRSVPYSNIEVERHPTRSCCQASASFQRYETLETLLRNPSGGCPADDFIPRE